MQRHILKSKLHRATVTGADLNYEGSIGIDEALMDNADILPNERVEIYNITNGQRFATYTILAPRNSGEIVLNGAAARCVSEGDQIIIVSFGVLDEQEARSYKPRIIILDENNRIIKGGRAKFIRQVT